MLEKNNSKLFRCLYTQQTSFEANQWVFANSKEETYTATERGR